MEENLVRDLVAAIRSAGVDFVTYLPETRLSQILPPVLSPLGNPVMGDE